jgi:hypothetical protein
MKLSKRSDSMIRGYMMKSKSMKPLVSFGRSPVFRWQARQPGDVSIFDLSLVDAASVIHLSSMDERSLDRKR